MLRASFVVLSVLASAVRGNVICHSIDPRASDDWCNKNCNCKPIPNCPASWCKCEDGPTPGPTPPPGPPSPPSPPSPPPSVKNSVFELDLFVNDPSKGWQADGFPQYLQESAAKYMNVAGISFIQPSNLMDNTYDLPDKVGNAVQVLRKQGVAVQLLVGGEISSGWNQLQANPEKAAANAIALMKKYDCGIEVDNESGGDSAGLIKFIQLCSIGKPKGTFLSMDVGGTPTKSQRAVIMGAIASLDWVNMMVSNPGYDQENSVKFGHQFGVPYEKLTVAYYAGTWVDNCNKMDSGVGGTLAGLSLFKKYGLKGLSIWAVGGMSYHNCKTDDAPGFSEALVQLDARNPLLPPFPTPTPPIPTPPPSPAPPSPPPTPPTPPTPAPSPVGSIRGFWDGWVGSSSSKPAPSSGWFFSFPGLAVSPPFNATPYSQIVAPPSWGTYEHQILTQGGGDTGWGDSFYKHMESMLNNYKPFGWDGVCWDWETTSADHTSEGFNSLMKATKAAGLLNIVTSTAEGPYIWQSSNKDATGIDWSLVDYFVPQMYGASGTLPAQWKDYARYWMDGASRPNVHDVTFAAIPMEKFLWGMPAGTCDQALSEFGGSGCVEWAYSPAIHPPPSLSFIV